MSSVKIAGRYILRPSRVWLRCSCGIEIVLLLNGKAPTKIVVCPYCRKRWIVGITLSQVQDAAPVE